MTPPYIEHTFEMDERTVFLRGGRFDGKEVLVDANAVDVRVYQNMYNQPRAVIAGAYRDPSRWSPTGSWRRAGLLSTSRGTRARPRACDELMRCS